MTQVHEEPLAPPLHAHPCTRNCTHTHAHRQPRSIPGYLADDTSARRAACAAVAHPCTRTHATARRYTHNREARPAIWPMTQVHEEPPLRAYATARTHTHGRQPRSTPGYLADDTNAHTQPHARARNRAKAHTHPHPHARARNRAKAHTRTQATAKHPRLFGR